ncbi:MAG TPA: ribonucleotide-diphosphate reductase subunit beta [Thermoleophilaceae bacterium]|nr:ribonucleotide-diphosphate reductase subunit beta [Thermoleophilaceae bacterium]
MATLLDHAQQGDVATVEDDAQITRSVKLMDPQQLYLLWERQPWSSHEIDLEQDKRHWQSYDDAKRDELLWLLSSFFIGEERVTTQFSGLVMAYDDEQEEAFLATQQVDEARHMQFFDRYYREVFAFDQADITARLDKVREHLTDSFVKLFDESLVKAGERLIADPADTGAKVDFVTMYHMVIEGMLALTGQHYLLDFFEKAGEMPGFVEGFSNIARDEHRHVAYGTWFLQSRAGEPEHAEQIQQTLAEQLPVAAGVLVPPGYELGDDYTFMGYTSQEQTEFAFTALSRRLKVIGVELPGVAA